MEISKEQHSLPKKPSARIQKASSCLDFNRGKHRMVFISTRGLDLDFSKHNGFFFDH